MKTYYAVCSADGTVYGLGDTLTRAVIDAQEHDTDVSDLHWNADPDDRHVWNAPFSNAPGLYWCPITYRAYVQAHNGDINRSIHGKGKTKQEMILE